MNLKEIMKKEMLKSGGKATVLDVPANRRPTAESLKQLNEEIIFQINANEAMRNRSIQNASKIPCR